MAKNIVTRFPPSPTGYLHVGGARTALFNYLFAKHNNGKIYLRFEDTDRERSKKEFEDDIKKGLTWLGVVFEKEVLKQSLRGDVYKKKLEKLISGGFAYAAEAVKNEPSKNVIRFKNPGRKVVFEDLIRGQVVFDTKELGDFIVARGIDEPLYHLAVVVDDAETDVTHVIRGEDHISNTPRQILILEALGFKRPIYAHIPLILAKDRSKLSKRHGAVSLVEYKKKGYLGEAMVNYLALLGWNPGSDKEIFTINELINEFDISRVQKGGAIFDEIKLRWINREHIKKIPNYQLSFIKEIKRLIPNADKEIITKLAQTLLDRIEVLSDIETLYKNGDISYFFEELVYDAKKMSWKGQSIENTKKYLADLENIISGIQIDFSAENIKNAVWKYAQVKGKGAVLWPLRYALSGRDKSPDPFTLASVIGKEKTLERIRNAGKLL